MPDGRTYTEAGYETHILHLKRDYYDYDKMKAELDKNYQEHVHRTYKLQHLDTIRTYCIAPVITKDALAYLKQYAEEHPYFQRPGCKKVKLEFIPVLFHDMIETLIPKINPRLEEQFIHSLSAALV